MRWLPVWIVALLTSAMDEMGFRMLLLASTMGAARVAATEKRVEKRMVALKSGVGRPYPEEEVRRQT